MKSSVKIASGTNGGPTLANSDYFGFSVASVGDLDGDGVTDLAVGANRDDTGGTNRGAVHLLMLNADGTVKTNKQIASGVGGGPTLADGDRFGVSVTSLGDLDGDGITDLAVGASFDDTGGTDCGAAYVLFMNAGGTVKNSLKIAGNTNGGPPLASGDYFGYSVASLGDLDGDGVTDLAVGADHDDTGGANRGALYVLTLNANGSVKQFSKLASDTGGGPTLSDGDDFGFSVTALGDLDGNGTTDLAVGAYRDDSGGTDRGAAYVLFLNGQNQTPTFTKGPDISVADEDRGQLYPGWATGISAGSVDEPGQVLTFDVSVPATQQGLFKVLPAINATTGNLTFTPLPNASGTVTVTVLLRDDGSAVNGSVNTSQPQIFAIEITKTHPWFNTDKPLDVDNNGQVAPLDALVVINYLNAGFTTTIVPGAPIGGGPGFLDTTKNNSVEPLDALLVINGINAVLAGGGEGLGEGELAILSDDFASLIGSLASDAADETMRRRFRS